MAVPSIALYASPPSSLCSSYDFDLLNCRSSSSSSSLQKPIMGGLSCLFSSSTANREELGSLWHERGEELKEYKSGSKYFGKKRDHQSPVSVFQSQFSCFPSCSVSGSSHLRIGCVGGANGVFNGFVRRALGSCVEYDSGSLRIGDEIDVVAGGGLEELTFTMEDVVMESGDHDPLVEMMLVDAQSRHKIFSEECVVKAFYEAEKAHRGQMRASGDPYLKHCVETAVLLASIGANSTVVAAGLLHDTFDDSFLCYDYLFRTFGAGVADLVEGVSKLSHLSKLARDNNTASKTAEADRLHTLFLAMADARAVLIKLADRLHNMMTLEALPLIKQLRFAKETLEIFVPLANRLGISTWKEQLENLCFKHLNPDQHKELSSRLEETFDVAMITSATEKLEQALRDEAISYHVLHGRHKSLYSIYCKMLRKKLNVDEILDIHGLRLIVENEKDCYRALKVVHQLWSQVPGKFKDYIIHPKFNGYQSLHTVVIGEGTVPLEVQIRTKQMHLQAEIGFAAHWRYKEGDSKHSSFVLQMVEWARWVITWQCETMAKDQSSDSHADCVKPPCAFPSLSEDCPFSYKPDVGDEGPIFVVMIENEKMSVQEFPGNSTVMDLLVRAGRGSPRWTPYGYPVKEELRPRLNHVPVSDPTCKLKMGDVVELTPAIPDKSLTVYREEIQRMYNHGSSTVSSTPPANAHTVGWCS